jgi:hypothetical protein
VTAAALAAADRDREPERYERAAVRWFGHHCMERPDVTLDKVEHARARFR